MTTDSDRAVRRIRELMTEPGTDWYAEPRVLRSVAYVVDAAHGVLAARDRLRTVLAATAPLDDPAATQDTAAGPLTPEPSPAGEECQVTPDTDPLDDLDCTCDPDRPPDSYKPGCPRHEAYVARLTAQMIAGDYDGP